ncbi:ABC transporter permease [Paenibacillus sanguinis]|uniref:ABC transporter permease n=1 Tax=Paenibacillus sanguinis TaxID=225906 RepID=UPI00037EA483|nr:ABC transporter permease [Paenibacillus sanguinis]
MPNRALKISMDRCVIEAILHSSLLELGMVLRFAKIYLIEGLGLFLAVSPVIAMVYRLKKGYWLALIFAEIYSFFGLFAGMQNTMRSLYPITAAFSVAGYYETTPTQWVASLFSLLACGGLSGLLLQRLDQRKKSYI